MAWRSTLGSRTQSGSMARQPGGQALGVAGSASRAVPARVHSGASLLRVKDNKSSVMTVFKHSTKIKSELKASNLTPEGLNGLLMFIYIFSLAPVSCTVSMKV